MWPDAPRWYVASLRQQLPGDEGGPSKRWYPQCRCRRLRSPRLGLAITVVHRRLVYSIDHLADRGLLRLGVKQFQFVLSKRLSQDIHGHLN